MVWWPWILAVEFSGLAVWGELHSCKVMGGRPDWVIVSILVCGAFMLAGSVVYDRIVR